MARAQFSFKTLFVVMTLVAVAIVLWMALCAFLNYLNPFAIWVEQGAAP